MKNIYDTKTAIALLSTIGVRQMSSFLLKMSSYVIPSHQVSQMITSQSSFGTVLSNMFNSQVKSNINTQVCILNTPKNYPIPEIFQILTQDSLVLDIHLLSKKYPEITTTLNSMPEYSNKIVFNYSRHFRLSGQCIDQPTFQNTVIRDILTRSFFQIKNNWLPTNIIKTLSKLYGVTMSSSIATAFNLDSITQSKLNALFIYYFLINCLPKQQADSILLYMNASYFLPDANILRTMLEEINAAHSSTPPELDDIFKLAESFLPQRTILNRQVLLSRNQKLCGDVITSTLAVEFVPYFVYATLLSLSNVKIGLSFKLKTLLVKSEINELTMFFKQNSLNCLELY